MEIVFAGSGLMLSFLLIGVMYILLTVYVLANILKNEFNGSDKLVWVLVVLFSPYFGSILYLIKGRHQRS